MKPAHRCGELRNASGFPLGLALILAALLACHARCLAAPGGGGSSNTTFTTSTTNPTITTSQTVDERQSTGLIQHIIDGRDQLHIEWSLDHPLSDPQVQDALRAALKVLNADKPPFPEGATLHTLSKGLGAGGSGTTTTQTVGTGFAVTTIATIGPANIFIGDDQQTPYSVPAGFENFNTNTAYETLQNQITTLTGGAPTIETELLQRTFVLDLGAVYSVFNSGLPVALAQRDALLSAHNAIGDVNGHIFRAMLGPNDFETPQGDGSLGQDMRVFTSGNFGRLNQGGGDGTAGLGQWQESASAGAEWKIGPALRLGFAASYIHSDTAFSGDLGSQRLDGGALSLYATWRPGPWYADLLYSAGLFSDSTRRNTLTGSSASGSADDWSHLVSLNLGYVFQVNDHFATGPYASLTYVHGSLGGYSENGGGSAALSYSDQSYNSLVSSAGWQASWKLRQSWGAVTPLLRLGWERENLPDAGAVSAALVESPFAILTGSGPQSFGSFGVTQSRQSAVYDALVMGAGVAVEIGDRWTLLLDAGESTDFGARNDFSVALRVEYRF